MKKLLALVLAPALLLAGATTALTQEATPPAAPEDPTIFIRQDPTLGPFFTDPQGMTLYLFTNDTTPGESTCYEQCAQNWPPFDPPDPLTLLDRVPGELTRIDRDDGTTQVAYNGIPLYYWINDEEPGDVTGHGVGDVWYVVAPGMEFEDMATPPAEPMAPPPATPAVEADVEVTLDEFSVTASATAFVVGQEYTFTVTNEGEFPHEFVIEPAGARSEPLEADGLEAEIEDIQSGETATLTWTFDEPGTYQISCHIWDHYPAGMVVTIHVTE